MEIPKINKTYNCFDDGKISNSRLYTVDITEVIPFKEIDNDTFELWKIEVKDCPYLYATKTDYFVKYINGEDGKPGIFVRTLDKGWFGIGSLWNAGRLDVDGSLNEMLTK
jgi:hypothetical protein